METTELPRVLVEEIVSRALAEDLAGGDVTTEACIEPGAQSRARAVARGDLVACGALVFARVFAHVDPSLVVETKIADGARAARGATMWTVTGRARSILIG